MIGVTEPVVGVPPTSNVVPVDRKRAAVVGWVSVGLADTAHVFHAAGKFDRKRLFC